MNYGIHKISISKILTKKIINIVKGYKPFVSQHAYFLGK